MCNVRGAVHCIHIENLTIHRDTYEVRCSVHLPSLTKESPFPVSETLIGIFKKKNCPPTFEGSSRFATLSMQTRTKMRRIKYSISILFLEMVFGKSDGSVKLESYFTAHLSGASGRFLQRGRVVSVNLQTSQFGSSGIVYSLFLQDITNESGG